MKEKKFDENVEGIYTTLSDEQKTEYKRKEETFNKLFLIIGIVFAVILGAILIGFSVWLIIEKEYGLLAFVIGFGGICSLLVVWIIKTSHSSITATDEIKIKTRIERLEKQKQFKKEQEEKQRQQALFKNVHYRLNSENIRKVSILDSYTEISDKLHAVLNYQEIIQTRVYKFKVDYKDGTSNIVTAAENSEEYGVLMPLVNKSSDEQSPTTIEKSNIEKLREYKQLLDEGIITQEEFEKKKKELL